MELYQRTKFNYPTVILCFYGSTGSGKTRWKQWFVDRGVYSIHSITTRAPRSPEDNEYYFVSFEKFRLWRRQGRLFNVNQYEGDFYGTRKLSVIRLPTNHAALITDITSLGLARTTIEQLTYRQSNPRVLPVSVYCAPPENWRELLKQRGNPERIAVGEKELEFFKDGGIYPGSEILRNEEDAQALLNKIVSGRQLSAPLFFDVYYRARTREKKYFWGKYKERIWTK